MHYGHDMNSSWSSKMGTSDLQEGYQIKVSIETNVRRNGFQIDMEENCPAEKVMEWWYMV